MTDRITFRLGSLSEPLTAACLQSGRSASEEIRARLAESFGMDAPDMPQGFATFSESKSRRLRAKSARVRRKMARDKA